jgi:hypothetical protein
MTRRFLARLLLVDRPPKVPIRELGRRDQGLFVVGIGLATVVGLTIVVVVLYTLGFVGLIDAQSQPTGHFTLILWVGSTYLLGLMTIDWVRRRAIRREQHGHAESEP